MTDLERRYLDMGIEYAEGMNRASVVKLPTGREVRKNSRGKWEAQPPRDNYWKEFFSLEWAICYALGVPFPNRKK